MVLKEAAQRCPQGVYLPDDPPRYARAFETVLDVLDRFSPLVEDAGVGLAFADAAGLEPLYGTAAALGARVRGDIAAATGQKACVGLAAGRFAAEVAARTAGAQDVAVVPTDDRAYLAERPIHLLPLPERTLANLQLLGLATIGAFAGLPANAVRSRYGIEGAQAWRLARGRDVRPLQGRKRPLVLHETVELEWEEHSVDRLAFALQALAQRLAARLAQRGLMAQQVGSRICWADGTVQRFTLHLPEPSADYRTFRDVARWRLDAWADAARAGAEEPEVAPHEPGVARIRLEVRRLMPLAGKQPSLLVNRSERLERANHAISRLRAQLGDAALFRTELRPDAWTLDSAVRRIDAYVDTSQAREASPLSAAWLAGLAGARGLTRLFTPPRPVSVSQADGASRVTLGGTTRRVVARYGPQRVQTGWWADAVDRDYLHVLLDDGSGLVLYHDRAHARWFAQGALD